MAFCTVLRYMGRANNRRAKVFDNQQYALAHALASRPRGMKIGDSVRYNDRTFAVLAIQQWSFNKGNFAVGLVWTGTCAHCGRVWYQLSETRVTHLNEECPSCDLVGVCGPTLDAQVAQNLLQHGAAPAAPPKEERYGVTEQHILDVIGKEFGDTHSVTEPAFVAHCAEMLPKPDAGKRDQRYFVTKRALQSLAKRENGPIALEHGRVIFCK